MTGRYWQTLVIDVKDRDRIAVASVRGIQEFAVRMERDLRAVMLSGIRSRQSGDHPKLVVEPCCAFQRNVMTEGLSSVTT